MFTDAHTVLTGTQFDCDLCVVGAGPAGIAIVDRLRDSALTVVLLESGGYHPELASQKLFRGENRGEEYYRLDGCRFRLFGGSTNRWGGWCRPLDAVDFERRDWLPWSGWPISQDSLAPYYADTAKLFELVDSHFDLADWHNHLPVAFDLDRTDFESVLFQYSPETNFGTAYRARLLAAKNVTVLLHANLTRIELEPDSARVAALHVSALTGPTFTVRPKAVVLAAGGIENARLLLASTADRAAGLGNQNDLVGRFFMEHLHVPAGHLIVAPGVAGRTFYSKATYNGAQVCGVIIPTAEAQGRRRLLATSIAVEPASYAFGTPFLGWNPIVTFGPINVWRRLRGGKFNRIVTTFKRNAERASGVPMRLRTWKSAQFARSQMSGVAGRLCSLYFRSEQVPDPASRIVLSDRRDALGVPLIALDWRVNPVDIAAITGWLEVLARDISARGIGTVVAPADGWQQEIIGGPHHMGTTRMSADPRHGVVDEHCRVHSVDNLYIAGSSVFTTGGYANPTFTLVALALRLADTLRDRLAMVQSVS